MSDLPVVRQDATILMQPVMKIGQLVQVHAALADLMKTEIWVENIHVMVLPGTNRRILLQPGAQLLGLYFGLRAEYEVEKVFDVTGENHDGEPFISYEVRCVLYRDDKEMAQGLGSCNSWETKYRYRWLQEEEVPTNLDPGKLASRVAYAKEFEFAIRKAELSGRYGKPPAYWARWEAAIENGEVTYGEAETKRGKSKTLTMQSTQYRVPNQEVLDLANTLLKMANKRAYVAAIISAVAAAEFVTQDLEDFPHLIDTTVTVDSKTTEPKAETKAETKAEKEAEPKEKAKGADDSAEWNWGVLFGSLAEKGVPQGDAFGWYRVKSAPAIKKKMSWEEALKARDIIIVAQGMGLSSSDVQNALKVEGVWLYGGTPDDAEAEFIRLTEGAAEPAPEEKEPEQTEIPI